MSDRLLALSSHPTARRVVSSLGVPLPEPLVRDSGAWREQELVGRVVAVAAGGDSPMSAVLAEILAADGAAVAAVGVDPAPFTRAGAAWGRAVSTESPERVDALVFDGTGLRGPGDLDALYEFFHPRMRALGRSGRVVILARPHLEQATPAGAATQRALEGFTRSIGREVGRRGGTSGLVVVGAGAEDRLGPVLRFLLSPRSAYVSGQAIRLSRTVRSTPAPRTRPLDGRTALVTGAARGIGAATARALAREGARVIVLDRPADDALAAQVAAEVNGYVLLADLGETDAPARIAAEVRDRFGGLDVLVHNAGVTRDRTLAKMERQGWDQALDINLEAVISLTGALDPLLRSRARITCLSSIAGIAGNVGQTNYSASKAGIIGYVEALAPKLARRGIAVNAVAPGFIETRLTAAIPVATREVARRLSNLAQGGLPEDVAEVIAFLSSPGAAALCGQILRVCGGSFVGA